LQHIEDRAQVRLKAEAVVETLRRLGGVETPAKLEVVTGESWGYRLRTQLHTESTGEGKNPRVGYFARGSHDLVAVDRCPVLVPELEELLPALPEVLGAGAPHRLDLAAGGPGPGGEPGEVTSAPKVEGLPQGEVEIAAAGLTYRYDARAFFQAHRGLLGELVERSVGPWEGEVAYDLYAGVGLFALALAARLARHNARHNRLSVEVEAQAVESWVPRLPQGPERVLVDPPRGGLAGPVRRMLRLARAERLTYVSCHPATLARDLRALGPAYQLESLTLLDLFPQTGHMEVVAQLSSQG
jgi:23S rRNA (uracil1939-C5)-methyltransferase